MAFWAGSLSAQEEPSTQELTPVPAAGLAGYAISVGDQLQLDFLDDQNGPYALTVGDDGAVQLPYLGTLVLAGQPLAQAHSFIAQTYVERGILVAPQIDVSVINQRPFSVLGDVRDPGYFDYRAAMTVETAVGLAGGTRRAPASEEARAAQKIVLQAELAQIGASLLREAVQKARLNTQLNGVGVIDGSAIVATTPQDAALIATLIEQDNTIIAAERAQFEAEHKLITDAIREITQQVELIEEQIVAQIAQVHSYDSELAGATELVESGLMAAPVRARLMRQVADEETDLLRLRTDLAATRRYRMGLMREELGLGFRRTQAWREELAAVSIRQAQLRADRASVLDRIALLQDWAEAQVDSQSGVTLSYVIRRRAADGSMETHDVSAVDPVYPGDVLIVRAVLKTPSNREQSVSQ